MDYISNGNEAVKVEVSEIGANNNVVTSYGKQIATAVNAKKKKTSDEKKSVRDRLK